MSLAEASARYVLETMTTEERTALPRYDGETLICLLKELEVHRSPLFFDQLIGKNIFHQGDSSTVMANAAYNVAISNQVMRGGKHYATFTDKGPNPHFYYGIIRPIKGWGDKRLQRFDDDQDEKIRSELLAERTDRWGDSEIVRYSEIHCCEFNYRTLVGWYTGWERGERYHGYHWCYEDEVLEERADEVVQGRAVGLLLDLDEGTLTAYADGRCLGVVTDGLTGEYCWMLSAADEFGSYELDGEAVASVERDKLPMSYGGETKGTAAVGNYCLR